MQKYKYLIFDADHTLYDYIADELQAFRDLYAELGMPVTEELLAFSRHNSEMVWTEAGLYDVHSPKIQASYHALYRSHVKGIFENVFKKFPCEADTEKTGERFLYHLSRQGKLFVGAEQVLSALSKKQGGRYEIVIGTNGLSFIQEGRLRGIRGLVERIFVSQALNAIKPLPAFYHGIFGALNATADECLMIGDSLSSDIAGANAVGMDACWFNPKGVELTGCAKPKYQIARLEEILSIL